VGSRDAVGCDSQLFFSIVPHTNLIVAGGQVTGRSETWLVVLRPLVAEKCVTWDNSLDIYVEVDSDGSSLALRANESIVGFSKTHRFSNLSIDCALKYTGLVQLHTINQITS
jgi:hypothetical protein